MGFSIDFKLFLSIQMSIELFIGLSVCVCVCVCSTVSQGAPVGRCTLGNPRATFEFQFCE